MEYDLRPELKKFEPNSQPEKTTPENFVVPEQQKNPPEKTEQRIEQTHERTKNEETNTKKKFRLPTFHRTPPVIPKTHDEITVRVEKIMEEGLGEAYQRLSPIAREEFKLKGEETVFKIHDLLKSTHVKAKKIFKLLLEWLRLLPGVNKFFLEQEAKIKTDRIIMINHKK